MTDRRGKVEVRLDILRATLREEKPTRIMYASNTSWVSLNRHMKRLLEEGLIKKVKPVKAPKRTHTLYSLTEEGKKYLRDLESLLSRIV